MIPQVKSYKRSLENQGISTSKASRPTPKCMDSRLQKNSLKAIFEHAKEAKFDPHLCKNSTALPALNGPALPFKVEWSHYEIHGNRRKMEDHSLYLDNEDRILIGIFDGHGGAKVSKIAKENFEHNFDQALREQQGDIHEAVKQVAYGITTDILYNDQLETPDASSGSELSEPSSEISSESEDSESIKPNKPPKEDLKKQGSTAVISYIDKKTNLIYTATLGDSETYIYRKTGDTLQAIPLSVIRNWASEKDAERAEKAYPGAKEIWEGMKAKKRRFPPVHEGKALNVSRAFGDQEFSSKALDLEAPPAISTKFKITVQKLLPGDIVLAACDGLWDYTKKHEYIVKDIIDDTKNTNPHYTLSLRIAFNAYKERKSSDNISVIALKII